MIVEVISAGLIGAWDAETLEPLGLMEVLPYATGMVDAVMYNAAGIIQDN